MEDPAVTERKIKRLRSLMAGIDNVYFNIKSERHSYYQALLSLGDRRVAPAIEAAERNGQNWRAAVAEAGVDADFYIFRDRSRDAVLPWDIIDGGMKARSSRPNTTRPSRRVDPAAEAAAGERQLLPVIQDARARSRGCAASFESLRDRDGDARFKRDRRALLVLLKRGQDELAQLVLRRRVRRSAAAARSFGARR